jgi:hypothetical protein
MQFLKLTAFLALALSASASVLSLASRQEDTCGNPEDPCGEPSLPDCCTGLQCVANDVGDKEVRIDLSVIFVMFGSLFWVMVVPLILVRQSGWEVLCMINGVSTVVS